jgi:hypothetical protein
LRSQISTLTNELSNVKAALAAAHVTASNITLHHSHATSLFHNLFVRHTCTHVHIDERRSVMEVNEAEITRLTLRCGALERMEREHTTLQSLAEQARIKLQEVQQQATQE